jgi:uncharacterized protein CbrC (UPF0167 family)
VTIRYVKESPRMQTHNLPKTLTITGTANSSAKERQMTNYKNYFAFSQEPLAPDIPTSKLYQTPGLKPATDRCLFAINLGAVCVITGEVGWKW